MKFRCITCGKTLSRSYDTDPEHGDLLGRPWYRDKSGLNHLVIVCLECGTIHDVSGSISRSLLMPLLGGRTPLKVHQDINPMELALMVTEYQDKTPNKSAREIAVKDLGIPEKVVEVLVERNILGPVFGQ